jgi:hypothetical protein
VEFFTVIGLGLLFHAALNSNKERRERADSGLLLGWIVTVLIAGGLKPSQRYSMPAHPAIAIITAVVCRGQIGGQFRT